MKRTRKSEEAVAFFDTAAPLQANTQSGVN
jgi:hypothetical protein